MFPKIQMDIEFLQQKKNNLCLKDNHYFRNLKFSCSLIFQMDFSLKWKVRKVLILQIEKWYHKNYLYKICDFVGQSNCLDNHNPCQTQESNFGVYLQNNIPCFKMESKLNCTVPNERLIYKSILCVLELKGNGLPWFQLKATTASTSK